MQRKKIGLFTDWTSTQYHCDLIKGISDKAEELDINLICIEGGSLESNSEFDLARNKIYNIVNEKSVDGLIIITNTIGRLITNDEIIKFINKYNNLPKVSIGPEIKNIPSITLDNKAGFKELIIHLIKDHNYKKFAFIKGPDNNFDAKERYDVFTNTLNKFNIPQNPELIIAGDFTMNAGYEAACKLLKYKNKIDAVLSCNDEMAHEVIEYFMRNNINIPSDIALTGFDDIDRSSFSFPSLTTVKQPIYEIGQKAFEMITDIINGKSISNLVKISTKLIIRESCGCRLLQNTSFIFNSKKHTDDLSEKNKISAKIKNYIKKKNIPGINKELESFIDKIINLFLECIIKYNKDSFINYINNYLHHFIIMELNFDVMEEIFQHFFFIINDIFKDDKNLFFIKDLNLQTIIILKEKSKQLIGKKYTSLKNFKETLLILSRELMIEFDQNKFYKHLSNVLPFFNIRNFQIIFFNDLDLPELSKTIYTFKDSIFIPQDEKEPLFNTYNLLPDFYLKKDNRYSIILMPLVQKEICYGYIIVEKEKIIWEFFDQIYIVINNALIGTLFFTELTNQKNKLLIQKENLNKNLNKIRKTMSAFIQTMALTMETRDPYTAGHQRRVSDLVRSIGTELKLSKDKIEGIRMASMIHDLGKIYIPSEILNRPGKLSSTEFELIKTHPAVAYEIIKNIDFPWPIADIIRQHHERLNGSGYPDKLKEDEILYEAKIIAVADVVEAMASHRPYRPALGIDKALDEIKTNKGILYDPEIVDICLDLFLKKGYKFK